MATLSWSTAADWDGAVSEDGVVHESVANTDHNDAGSVKRGYSSASPYLSADMVGYWPYHEDSGSTAYDQSGNNNDASINGATVGASGILNTTGYNFDGTDDDVKMNGDASWSTDFGTTGLTISMWVKLDSVSSRMSLCYTEGASTSWWLQFNPNGNQKFRFLYRSSNTNPLATSTTSATTGTWYHVIAMWTGSQLELVINGALEDTASNSSALDTKSNANRIGNYHDNRFWLDGTVTDVRIYNRNLSSTEYQALYDVANTNGTLTTDWRSP